MDVDRLFVLSRAAFCYRRHHGNVYARLTSYIVRSDQHNSYQCSNRSNTARHFSVCDLSSCWRVRWLLLKTVLYIWFDRVKTSSAVTKQNHSPVVAKLFIHLAVLKHHPGWPLVWKTVIGAGKVRDRLWKLMGSGKLY